MKTAYRIITYLIITVLLITAVAPFFADARFDPDPFDDVVIDVAPMTQVEQAIAYARSWLGSRSFYYYCQRFVRLSFESAGIYGEGVASAEEACKKWMVSASRENIPVGAVLYFNTSVYGHSAIYLGNNRMIHALSRVEESEITPFFWDAYIGWGWQCGIEPTGTYYESESALTGEIYETTETLLLCDKPNGEGIATVPKGTRITVSENDGTWAKTEYNSVSGYVRAMYCSFLYSLPEAGAQLQTVKTAKAVSVAATPDKYYYIKGEGIDTTGLVLKLEYYDGSTEYVSDGFDVFTPVAACSGAMQVLIGYGDELTSFAIVVADTNEGLEPISLRSLRYAYLDEENGLIYATYEGLTVSRLIGQLRNSDKIYIYSADGKPKETGLVATGDYLLFADDSESAAAVIIKQGDVNGNGVIDAYDALCAKRFAAGTFITSDRLCLLALGGSLSAAAVPEYTRHYPVSPVGNVFGVMSACEQ